MENKIDRILLNQRAIMKNLAFGFVSLAKDDVLNESLLTGIEETEKILNPDTNSSKSVMEGLK